MLHTGAVCLPLAAAVVLIWQWQACSHAGPFCGTGNTLSILVAEQAHGGRMIEWNSRMVEYSTILVQTSLTSRSS